MSTYSPVPPDGLCNRTGFRWIELSPYHPLEDLISKRSWNLGLGRAYLWQSTLPRTREVPLSTDHKAPTRTEAVSVPLNAPHNQPNAPSSAERNHRRTWSWHYMWVEEQDRGKRCTTAIFIVMICSHMRRLLVGRLHMARDYRSSAGKPNLYVVFGEGEGIYKGFELLGGMDRTPLNNTAPSDCTDKLSSSWIWIGIGELDYYVWIRGYWDPRPPPVVWNVSKLSRVRVLCIQGQEEIHFRVLDESQVHGMV